MTTTLRMADILTNYRNKDGIPWDQFFTYLRVYEHDRLALLGALMATGKLNDDSPVVVTDDREVIDGHHRLCVMQSLGFPNIEVDVISASDLGEE